MTKHGINVSPEKISHEPMDWLPVVITGMPFEEFSSWTSVTQKKQPGLETNERICPRQVGEWQSLRFCRISTTVQDTFDYGLTKYSGRDIVNIIYSGSYEKLSSP
jgi:hypothetical protein